MSTTTSVQVTSPAHAAGPPDPLVPVRVRRLAGPVALVVGSVFTITGMTLHVKGAPEDEALVREVAAHSTQWLVSHFFQSFGMLLVAAGVVGAVRLARGRGAALTAVGVVVTSVGGALMSLGDISHGAVAYSLVDQVDPATSLEIQKAFFSNPAFGGLGIGGLLLPIGVLLLGAGVLRSGAVPRWAAVVLLISPIAIQVAFSTGVPVAVLGLPFVVGMAALARAVARS